MKQTVKFKVELEIEVEYDGVPEGMASTPYTRIGCGMLADKLTLETDKGNIVNGTITRFERKPE